MRHLYLLQTDKMIDRAFNYQEKITHNNFVHYIQCGSVGVINMIKKNTRMNDFQKFIHLT